MRNVASVLLLAALVVGYYLFVHNKDVFTTPSDPTIIPGSSDYSRSTKGKPSASRRSASVPNEEEKIEYKYGGEASRSKPQQQQQQPKQTSASIKQQQQQQQPRRDDEYVDEESEGASYPSGSASVEYEGRDHEDHEGGHDEEEDGCIPHFTRDYIMDCEGYYRSSEDADEDLPWPRPSKNNWPCLEHKQRWMAKLRKVQDISQIKSIPDPLLAQSRLEKKALSNKLYLSRDKNKEGHPICWTQDLLNYYVDKFDVVPSEEFYYWVLDYEL